jgi:hypothetical protein
MSLDLMIPYPPIERCTAGLVPLMVFPIRNRVWQHPLSAES